MKQRRIDRLHGRIMSVETKVRGDSLAEDAAAGATTLIVGDAADFDEDGGWLVINDQVIEYLEVEDDEGTITLAEGLTAAAEEGDAVHVWSTLYDEAVDYQEALVELDGEYDNPEPVVAEVAEGVGDLPEGDRGVAGESCTLLRVSDDEWEVVGVGGRARKSKSIRFEADDFHTITAGEVAAGAATVPLSHRPLVESVVAVLGIPNRPTEYTVDYDEQEIAWPLDGWEQAGDVIWVHYAYRKGFPRRGILVPYRSSGWKYLLTTLSDGGDYSGTAFDDSAWSTGTAAFGDGHNAPANQPWPETTHWPITTRIWLRRTIPAGRDFRIEARFDDVVEVWWNGNFVGTMTNGTAIPPETFIADIPDEYVVPGDQVLALRVSDEPSPAGDAGNSFIDVRVSARAAS